MSDQAAAGRSSASSGPAPVFDERWHTPLWWYPVAIAIAAILAAEFRVAAHDLTVWVPFGVLLPGSAIIVWTMGRSHVQVVGGQLRVNEAHLPLPVMAAVHALDAATLRRLVGRHGDPAAYVSIRPWIGPGVQIVLDDPDDPCPYWIVSSRRPRDLVAALQSGR